MVQETNGLVNKKLNWLIHQFIDLTAITTILKFNYYGYNIFSRIFIALPI
jgi:hypothetical protein